MKSTNFPIVDLATIELTEHELSILTIVFKLSKGSKVGQLRASKPTLKFDTTSCPGYRYPTDPSGSAAYVWRMLCFYCIAYHPHCCMPVTADFDIPHDLTEETTRRKYADFSDWYASDDYKHYSAKRAEKRASLDNLVDRVLAIIPKSQWGGVMRWGKAIYG